jgi:serine/threonine-protein kinase
MSDDDLREAKERVGTVLGGKYHIDSVLGVGGMAVVYAATHRNRKRFAVKVLHAELAARRDIRARFLREGYVANSVKHPGVVAVLDDDVDTDGSAFLVMELLEGATVDALGARLEGRLPVREALAVTHQLLDVLNVAHESAIVHRDVKPANLFVCTEGHVKVLDFGIARLRDVAAGVQSTRAGAMLGTPSFMAPEQAQAQGDEIDPRTDVWAAGASLFNMISGQYVHEGESARQLMIRAATAPARSLLDVAPDSPAAVVELVAKALAFEKSARWDSAAAMREAVARIHAELFGAIAHEHLKACLEHAPREIESARTEPGPREAPHAPAPKKVAKVATAFGTAPESPHARHGVRAAASDVATTTSRPVANRKTEGAPRRKLTLVVASIAVVVGLAAAGFVLKTSKTASETRAMSAASKPESPPSSFPPAPPTLTAAQRDVLAPEVPPPSPSAEASAASNAGGTVASARAVAPLPATVPPASTAGPRIAPSVGMPASTPTKASARRSAPSAEPPKRDPLHIELQ